MYGLFPSEAGQTSGVTKAQLHSLRDSSFRWPGEEAIHPETLPALAKNIVVNFMEHFFKGEGRAIVRCEVGRMKPQVIVCSLYCHPSSLRKPSDDVWLATFSSRPRLTPLRSQSSKKLRLPKRDPAVRVQMAKAADELPTELRRPKIRRGSPLLVLRLARCEGTVANCVEGVLFSSFSICAGPCVGPCAGVDGA